MLCPQLTGAYGMLPYDHPPIRRGGFHIRPQIKNKRRLHL